MQLHKWSKRGGHMSFGLVAIVAFLAAIGTAVSNVEAQDWNPPQTPWGDPDLQGIWTNEVTTTPMERPAEYGERELLTDEEVAERARMDAIRAQGASGQELDGVVRPWDLDRTTGYDKNIVGQEYNRFWTDPGPRKLRDTWRRTSLVIDPPDGRIPPFTRELLRRWETREERSRGRGQRDSWLDANPAERCLVTARGRLGGDKVILQAPGYVVFRVTTLNHTSVYIVPLDGRPRVPSHMRLWLGDARGHWEGDTLVVVSTNILGKQDGGDVIPTHGGLTAHAHYYPGSGEGLRYIERYTRVSGERIEYQYTVDDPMTYVKPFTVLRPLGKEDDSYLLLDPACHEGNYAMANSLNAARVDEEYAMQASEDERADRRPQVQASWEELRQWELSQQPRVDRFEPAPE